MWRVSWRTTTDRCIQAARALYSALAAHRLHEATCLADAGCSPRLNENRPTWPRSTASLRVHLIDRVTPNTFLSGQVKDGKRPCHRQPGPACSIALVQSGIIAYPDFSTVLSMNRAPRDCRCLRICAASTTVTYGKEYGTDEDRKEHEWKGRITFAVATTDEVGSRHYSVFQSLGERFVMIRWGRPGGVEAAPHGDEPGS